MIFLSIVLFVFLNIPAPPESSPKASAGGVDDDKGKALAKQTGNHWKHSGFREGSGNSVPFKIGQRECEFRRRITMLLKNGKIHHGILPNLMLPNG